MKVGVAVLGLVILVPGLLLLAVGVDEVNYYESDEGIDERNDGVDDEQDEKYYQMYQWFQIWGALLLTIGMMTLLVGALMHVLVQVANLDMSMSARQGVQFRFHHPAGNDNAWLLLVRRPVFSRGTAHEPCYRSLCRNLSTFMHFFLASRGICIRIKRAFKRFIKTIRLHWFS